MNVIRVMLVLGYSIKCSELGLINYYDDCDGGWQQVEWVENGVLL